jgi:hypothetical protein
LEYVSFFLCICQGMCLQYKAWFIFVCLKLYKVRAWVFLHLASSLAVHVWGNFCSCAAHTSRLGSYRRGKRSNLLIGSCNQSSREISVNWKLVSFLPPFTSLPDNVFIFSHFSWALSITRVFLTDGTSLSENTLVFLRI